MERADVVLLILDAVDGVRKQDQKIAGLIERRKRSSIVLFNKADLLKEGEMDTTDFTLKGAVDFLYHLFERGVMLYLASGTDREHVVNEAETLGYARFFEGRIYGAVGDVRRYSKRQVIERILQENNLNGNELACVGDGPVELRETRRKGGVAVGIASDEVRRYGWNMRKRARLIRAGADIVVPDFSQWERLDSLLFERESLAADDLHLMSEFPSC